MARFLADRAYDSDAMRQSLAERGAWANVKPMPNRKNIPAFSPFLYRYQSLRRVSTSSNTFEPSPHDTTSAQTTILQASNLLQPEFGCGLANELVA